MIHNQKQEAFDDSFAFQCHIEEYRSVRQEISEQWKMKHQLIFIFLGGLAAAITFLQDIFTKNTQPGLLLMVSILSSAVGIMHENMAYALQRLARYQNYILRPKIEGLINKNKELTPTTHIDRSNWTKVWEWDDYLSDQQYTAGLVKLGCLALLESTTIALPVLVSLVSLIVFLQGKYANNWNMDPSETLLLCLSLLAFFALIGSVVLVIQLSATLRSSPLR